MKNSPTQIDRIFTLMTYGQAQHTGFIVVTPAHEDIQKVHAAWAYAVRYTAKGLDLPDYSSAVELLKQRHPSWTIIESRVMPIQVNLAIADNDVPEGE